MVILTDAWRKQYEDDFATMKVHPDKWTEARSVAKRLSSNEARYAPAASGTGVPWYLIAILHEREASGDFAKYLGDGEPLDRVTHDVPRGRGPFHTFNDGCIDALKYDGFDKVRDWSIGSVLFHMEAFNGEGYHDHGIPSPYVWAGSNKYSRGKYLSDNKFSYKAVDRQLGGAVILAAIIIGMKTSTHEEGA